MRSIVVLCSSCIILALTLLALAMLSSVHSLRLSRGTVLRSLARNQSSAWRKQALSTTSVNSDSSAVPLHPSFDTLREFTIPEYSLKGTIFQHRKSGAEVISIKAPDDNKVFGITFPTPPSDHTGVPHILEHSVLCGSRKYPVKEPFVHLLRSSLQNFLNAFTYPDRTCYPVASTNAKDFYNLVNVYLDAVLFPRAAHDPLVLKQEGWHYELEQVSDPLSIKGVVYNEMKGVYSSPESLLGREAQRSLFPDNCYAVDSGGDPAHIPSLTFEQFRAFHETFYHPQQAKIFFYGDDDEAKRLALLEEYLSLFDKRSPSHTQQTQVALQRKKDLTQTQGGRRKVLFPISSEAEERHMLTVNWLLNEEPLTPKEILAVELVDYLLLGTPTSALRKALTESGLGESVIGGGLSDDLQQSTYSVGLKGVKAENVSQVETLIDNTLRSIAETGFESDAVTAAVNTLEFRMREFNTGSFPKGLSVMLAMLKNWLYGRDPTVTLTFTDALRELKEEIAAGRPLFQEILKTRFLANTHRSVVEMVPDRELEERERLRESERLAALKASLSQEELQRIVSETHALRERQSAEDSLADRQTLPSLARTDINPDVRVYPTTVHRDDPSKGTILLHPLPSSDILYADIAFDYQGIDFEDLELLPLLARLFLDAGTHTRTATALSREIGSHAGGLGFSFYNDHVPLVENTIAHPDEGILLHLMVRGKVMREKIPLLVSLVEEVLCGVRLDNQQRAVELLREFKARKESALLSSAHSLAATRLALLATHPRTESNTSSNTPSFLAHMGELTNGLTSVRNAQKLLTDAETHWPDMLRRLERMRERIVRTQSTHIDTHTHSDTTQRARRRQVVVNLTGDERVLNEAVPHFESLIDRLAQHSTHTHNKSDSCVEEKSVFTTWKQKRNELYSSLNANTQQDGAAIQEGYTIPSLVNYVGYGGALYSPGESVSGSLSVVTRHLSNTFMWDTVRVLGGAYGGFARVSEVSGRLACLSYRDPQVLSTVQACAEGAEAFLAETAQTLAHAESEGELLQSVIGAIGDLDAPMSVDQQGYLCLVHFLAGETRESRQRWRDGVLHTRAEDFAALAERMRALRESGRARLVVFGAQQALAQANDALPAAMKMKIEPALRGNNNNVNGDKE